jgi:hypothetical protein
LWVVVSGLFGGGGGDAAAASAAGGGVDMVLCKVGT